MTGTFLAEFTFYKSAKTRSVCVTPPECLTRWWIIMVFANLDPLTRMGIQEVHQGVSNFIFLDTMFIHFFCNKWCVKRNCLHKMIHDFVLFDTHQQSWSVYKYSFVNAFYHSSSLTLQDEVNINSTVLFIDGLRERKWFRREPQKNCWC